MFLAERQRNARIQAFMLLLRMRCFCSQSQHQMLDRGPPFPPIVDGTTWDVHGMGVSGCAPELSDPPAVRRSPPAWGDKGSKHH